MKILTLQIDLHSLQYEELSDSDRKLVDSAKSSTYNAYNPYSHFAVGAALLLENGETVLGCNQENAAFGLTICAERTAIFSAQAQYPNVPVVTLCIAARNIEGEFVKEPVTPCGSCRQVILEQEQRHGKPIRILLVGENQIIEAATVKDLLPLSFVDEDMR